MPYSTKLREKIQEFIDGNQNDRHAVIIARRLLKLVDQRIRFDRKDFTLFSSYDSQQLTHSSKDAIDALYAAFEKEKPLDLTDNKFHLLLKRQNVFSEHKVDNASDDRLSRVSNHLSDQFRMLIGSADRSASISVTNKDNAYYLFVRVNRGQKESELEILKVLLSQYRLDIEIGPLQDFSHAKDKHALYRIDLSAQQFQSLSTEVNEAIKSVSQSKNKP